MKKNISVVLIGIGGYGNLYVRKLLESGNQLHVTIAGVVDIYPEKCENYKQIIEKNIPIFSSIEGFYEKSRADLAIISTPIHHHVSQTCYALEHGSHVLCEKPISPTIEGARRIIQARNKAGRFVAIGFNWSFSPSVQQLKQDIMNGLFGKPIRLKTIVLWPRDNGYFTRSAWAGRQRNDDGALILDSVANNATSHYLHHMFYLLGSEKDKSARLRELTAELYRANAIENFDTCAVRAVTEENTEILYFATHAVKDTMEPTFVFEFEKATLTYSKGQEVQVHFHDGTKKVYPDPEKDHLQKLTDCVEAAASEQYDIPCGPEAACSHALCIKGMHDSVPDIASFPKELIHYEEKSKLIWVDGLRETFIDCYDHWCLPGETETSWAKKGNSVYLSQDIFQSQ